MTEHKNESRNVSVDHDREVSRLVNTSVDDMRRSLWNYHDIAILQQALIVLLERDNKTRAKLLASRIRALEKQ